MLISFRNKNVGPMADRELRFASHLNVFTGDNSLGKSFLLDMIWFGLTQKWPHDLNAQIDGGFQARPRDIKNAATLTYELETMTGNRLNPFSFAYDKGAAVWKVGRGRKPQPGLVVYAMADGSFAVWDPILNYWREHVDDGATAKTEKPAAYVLSRAELWPGDLRQHSAYCKGVIEGWAAWQHDKDDRLFKLLTGVIRKLVPETDRMEIGELESVPLVDGGDQPVLKFPYGSVRLQNASSAVRRLVSLAYVLVWAVSQHLDAARNRGMDSTRNIILLFDEIESHLHPRWQRTVVRGVLEAIPRLCEMAGLMKNELQMFVSTHSPLVMAALEDEFHCKSENCQEEGCRNKWFDFNMDVRHECVKIEEPDFKPCGTAECWLKSSAFDLESTYSPEVEKLVEEAEEMLNNRDAELRGNVSGRLRDVARELARRLPQGDDLVYRLYDLIGEESAHDAN